MTASEQEADEVGSEIVPFPTTRTVDLRSAATDSWTDVVTDVAHLANHVANTEFVPKELRGNAPAIAAAVLYGRELGLPPMTSLQGVAMVKGRPSLYAETMRALILQAGHELSIDEASSSKAVVSGRRRGSERWSTATWTLEDARRAGLLVRGGNYEKYPRQMLLARASVELARMIFADVIHGMRSAEEMMDELDTIVATPEPQPAEKTTTVQRKRPAKKTTANQVPEQDMPAEPPPARKRVDPPVPKTAPANDARDRDDTGTNPPDPAPSPEQQQEQIRRLSEERRNTKADRQGPAKDPTAAPESPAGDDQHADDPDDDIVDAEIVTGRDTGPKITAAQRAAIQMHFRRLNVDDRDEYLLIINMLLELEPGTIGSTNELRGGEPQRVLKILETLKDRDALDQRLNGQDQLA